MICPWFLNPVHETSWVNYKFCYKTVINLFWFGFAERAEGQDAPNPRNSSHLVSLVLGSRRAVTVWPPARYLWAHENCQCETDGNNILRTQEALGPISLPFSLFFYRLGSEVPGDKGLVHSVTAYDDKRCQSQPMVPLHDTHRGKKEADGHSSDASWMWSKFWLATFFVCHWVQTKAEKRARWSSSSIWQCLEWRHPSTGSSISSFRSSSGSTSKCRVTFLSGSPRRASSFDLRDRQSAQFPRPQRPHIRHPWLRLEFPSCHHIGWKTFTLGQLACLSG